MQRTASATSFAPSAAEAVATLGWWEDGEAFFAATLDRLAERTSGYSGRRRYPPVDRTR